jgi:hypothetical protein
MIFFRAGVIATGEKIIDGPARCQYMPERFIEQFGTIDRGILEILANFV